MGVGDGLQVGCRQGEQEISFCKDHDSGEISTRNGNTTWRHLRLGTRSGEGKDNREGQETTVTRPQRVECTWYGSTRLEMERADVFVCKECGNVMVPSL